MTESHYLGVPWPGSWGIHWPHPYSPREAAAAPGRISSEQRMCYMQIVISDGSEWGPVRREKEGATRIRNILQGRTSGDRDFFHLKNFGDSDVKWMSKATVH